MSSRRVGAAVVIDPEHSGVGILTERDILDSLAAGQDPNIELVAAHRTVDVVYASPDWTPGAGRVDHGPGGIPPPGGGRGQRGDRAAVHARHRALLVRDRGLGAERAHRGTDLTSGSPPDRRVRRLAVRKRVAA